MRSVNLIPAYRIERRRKARRLRAWLGAVSLYGVGLLGAWAGAQIVWPDGRMVLASESASLETRTHEDQAAARQLQPRLAQARTTLAATRSIGDQPDWSHLVALVARWLGDEAVLRSCRLEPLRLKTPDTKETAARIARYQLRLEGYGRSQAAVLAYVRALEETGLFDGVKLIETRGEAFYTGQAIAFQIECTLSDGVAGGTS